MATKHPEVKAELDAIEQSLEGFAQANSREMPAGLSDSILNKIDELEAEKTPLTKAGSLKKFLATLAFLMAATIVVAILFLVQNHNLKKDLSKSQTLIDSLRQDSIDCQNEVLDLERRLNILRSEANQTIIMKPVDTTLRAIASIYYNPETQKAYLDVVNIPTPPAGKQYQLWALVDGQPPRSMDVFDMPTVPGAFLEVDFVEKPIAFAVSLEDEGGSPQPTQVVLYGDISS